MFYYLSFLKDYWSELRVFQYITVRSVCAAGSSFLFCLVMGPPFVKGLRMLKIGQFVRKEDSARLFELHGSKQGTPTMGGGLIIVSILLSTLLWARPDSPRLWLVVSTMVYLGIVGAIDDYSKLRRKQSKGLSGKGKILLQSLWVIIVCGVMLLNPPIAADLKRLTVPFLKDPLLQEMGLILTFVFLWLILVGSSNAVNLTDGLDGLAVGCSSSAGLSYLIMAYVAGHANFADYLNITYVPDAGELSVFCGAFVGACLGFLWYNCHPASVFMGDTGSLALGGTIAMVAVLIEQELTLLIVGGVFVWEALSVILQVSSYRLRGGRRIFLCAPVHHHFQFKGWSETQVTVRFWTLSILCALLGLLCLKIR